MTMMTRGPHHPLCRPAPATDVSVRPEAEPSPRDHRRLFNANRAHTAQSHHTPTELAPQWTTTHQPPPHNRWTTKRVPLTTAAIRG